MEKSLFKQVQWTKIRVNPRQLMNSWLAFKSLSNQLHKMALQISSSISQCFLLVVQFILCDALEINTHSCYLSICKWEPKSLPDTLQTFEESTLWPLQWWCILSWSCTVTAVIYSLRRSKKASRNREMSSFIDIKGSSRLTTCQEQGLRTKKYIVSKAA